MKKKILLVVIILLVVTALAGGYFYFQKWREVKQQKIQLGLSNNKFPWRDYTAEELAKMYPQTKYADVPTRVTPEQTYAKFREALRTNNLEMAIEQLNEDSVRYQENIGILTKLYNDKKLTALYNDYPEQISKSFMAESIGQFYFLKKSGEYNLRQYIDFLKDANGDWKMASL